MQLVAKIDQLGQAKLEAFIRLPGILIPEPITFLVDTGCSATCLLPDDVIRLNVKHENLPTVMKSIVTANGPVSLKVLQNVGISLPVRRGLLDKDGYVHVPMSQLSFLPPSPNYKALPSNLIFSLLGMDVLHHFPKWRWGKTELVMEELNQSLEELKMSFKL
jgi:hypothetical protein